MTADLRPVDDPLLYQLLDSRRARVRMVDNLWVRIIDLPAALARRAYAAPVEVVLEVSDGLLPGNAGRWRLRAGRCRAAGRRRPAARRSACGRIGPADIALDVRELGAAYLGGTRLARSRRPGWSASCGRARWAASTAMGWDPAPWCPRIF